MHTQLPMMRDRAHEIRSAWEAEGREDEIVDPFDAALVLAAWDATDEGRAALRSLLARVDRCEIGWDHVVVLTRVRALISSRRLVVLRIGGWAPPGAIPDGPVQPLPAPPGHPPPPGRQPPPPGSQPPPPGGPPSTEDDWIEIVLIDTKDEPVPFAAFEVTLPDGSVRAGMLDGDGFARVLGINPGGMCEVRFPDVPADGIEAA